MIYKLRRDHLQAVGIRARDQGWMASEVCPSAQPRLHVNFVISVLSVSMPASRLVIRGDLSVRVSGCPQHHSKLLILNKYSLIPTLNRNISLATEGLIRWACPGCHSPPRRFSCPEMFELTKTAPKNNSSTRVWRIWPCQNKKWITAWAAEFSCLFPKFETQIT